MLNSLEIRKVKDMSKIALIALGAIVTNNQASQHATFSAGCLPTMGKFWNKDEGHKINNMPVSLSYMWLYCINNMFSAGVNVHGGLNTYGVPNSGTWNAGLSIVSSLTVYGKNFLVMLGGTAHSATWTPSMAMPNIGYNASVQYRFWANSDHSIYGGLAFSGPFEKGAEKHGLGLKVTYVYNF